MQLLGMTVAALLSGCQSVPPDTAVPIAPDSSLMFVDVLFPEPLNRDPSLVQVWFMKQPTHDGQEALPELIPASFVKASRAYLIDATPGTYSVVAVAAEYAPPWNARPIEGVTDTVASGISSDAMIFPTVLIARTATAIAPGEAAFMGALSVRRGDHINAHTLFQDDLQKRIAERVSPGVTDQSGIRGWLRRTRLVDLEHTSFSNQPADRESFLAAARADLGESPWAGIIPREAAPEKAAVARPELPAPIAPVPVPIPPIPDAIPEVVVAKPPPAVVEAPPAPPEPEPLPVAPKPVAPAPRAPEPVGISLVPPDSPLAKIALGMRHDEVQRILGNPDARIDRATAKAWIPFYTGPDTDQRDWIYEGRGRVVFSLYRGALEVIDVVYDPNQRK